MLPGRPTPNTPYFPTLTHTHTHIEQKAFSLAKTAAAVGAASVADVHQSEND